LYGGLGYKQANVNAVNGPNGQAITSVGGGALGLQVAALQRVLYAYAGATSEQEYLGGKLAGFVSIPYTETTKTINFTNQVPSTSPAYNAVAGLAAWNTQNSSGANTRLDDIEFGGAWIYSNHVDTKFGMGLSLKTTTGGYDPYRSGSNIGTGYYSLKPSIGGVRKFDNLYVAGKLEFAINSNNSSANYRTGNMVSAEMSFGVRTQYGDFGLNLHQVNQIQNDSGTGLLNPANKQYYVSAPTADGHRLHYLTYSPTYTVLIPSIKSFLMVQLTKFQSATYAQVYPVGVNVRLTRVFDW